MGVHKKHFSREEQTFYVQRINDIRQLKQKVVREEYFPRKLTQLEKVQLVMNTDTTQVTFAPPEMRELTADPNFAYIDCFKIDVETPKAKTDGLLLKRLKDIDAKATEIQELVMENIAYGRGDFLLEYAKFKGRVY